MHPRKKAMLVSSHLTAFNQILIISQMTDIASYLIAPKQQKRTIKLNTAVLQHGQHKKVPVFLLIFIIVSKKKISKPKNGKQTKKKRNILETPKLEKNINVCSIFFIFIEVSPVVNFFCTQNCKKKIIRCASKSGGTYFMEAHSNLVLAMFSIICLYDSLYEYCAW